MAECSYLVLASCCVFYFCYHFGTPLRVVKNMHLKFAFYSFGCMLKNFSRKVKAWSGSIVRGIHHPPTQECAPAAAFVKSNSNSLVLTVQECLGPSWKKAHSQKTGVSHYQETVNKINLLVGEGPSIPVMSNIMFGVASLHYKQDKVGSLHTLTKHCHGNFQCKLSLFDFFSSISLNSLCLL